MQFGRERSAVHILIRPFQGRRFILLEYHGLRRLLRLNPFRILAAKETLQRNKNPSPIQCLPGIRLRMEKSAFLRNATLTTQMRDVVIYYPAFMIDFYTNRFNDNFLLKYNSAAEDHPRLPEDRQVSLHKIISVTRIIK
jgi:hypothetical protein